MNIFQALFITGVVLIFLNNKLTCPPSIVKYKYLPRTLNNNMVDSAFSSKDIMKTYTNGNHNWIEFNNINEEVNDKYMKELENNSLI